MFYLCLRVLCFCFFLFCFLLFSFCLRRKSGQKVSGFRSEGIVFFALAASPLPNPDRCPSDVIFARSVPSNWWETASFYKKMHGAMVGVVGDKAFSKQRLLNVFWFLPLAGAPSFSPCKLGTSLSGRFKLHVER